jgi:uncharacterized cupin superfamily protein
MRHTSELQVWSTAAAMASLTRECALPESRAVIYIDRMSNEPQSSATEVRGPISSVTMPWETWSEGTRFGGRMKHLTNAFGVYRVGVRLEELEPGKQSVPAHYHTDEEEHLFILEGTVSLRLGDQRLTMNAGDYICFPAAQPAAHCLTNESSSPCRYLMIGEKRNTDTCIYPDSNKILVRATNQIYDKSKPLTYWQNENTNL